MLMGAAGQSLSGTGGFVVNNSALFNEPDDEYFTRTPTSASSQKTWTFSTWIKRGKLGSDQRIFTATNNGCELFFDANDKLNSYQYTSGSYVWNYITTQVFRDPHAWYNIVVRIDTTQSTSGDRVRLYVNGEQIEDFDTSTAPSQNATGFVNSAVAHYIGRYSGSNSMHYDGYLAETILIDGQSLAPASFGETDDNGVWRPIEVSSSGLFDASNSVVPTATTWTLGSTMSAGTGTLDKSGAGGTSALYVRMLEGDFKVTFTAAALNDALFGVFDYTEIGTFDASQDDGFLDSMTNSFWYDEGQTDVNYGNTTVAASKTIAAGSVVTIERSGSTIKITDDGSDVHEFTQNFAGPVGFIAGHRNTGANSLDFNSISFDGASGAGKNGFYFPYTDSGNLGGDYQTGGITSITLSGEWNGDTGDFGTLDTDIIATGGNQGAIRTNDTFTGDFAFDFIWKGGSNPAYVGVYEIDEDGTFSNTASDGGMGSMTDSFYLFFTSGNAVNALKGSSTEASSIFTAASGERVKFQRSGSQFKVFENGVLRHTFTGTSSNEVRILIGQSSSSLDWENFRWVTDGTTLGNPFTPVNSPTQTTDTPTDNHATFSPLLSNASKVTLSEGNMRGATSTSSGHVGLILSGFELPTAGKYYWEWVTNTVGTTPSLGWRSIENLNPNGHTSVGNNQAEFITGNDYNTGDGRILSSTIDGSTSLSQASYGNFLTVSGGNPLANGTVLGCAYDADNGLAWFSYNNTWVDGNGTDSSSTVKGEIEAGTSGSQAFTTANGAVGEADLFIMATVRSVSSGNFTLRTRSDQWTGDCPSGFTALSTKNQAEAVTFAIEDGSAHFQATTYDGSGGSNEINQSGNSSFQPDWVWLKERDGGNHGTLINAVRGGNKGVYPSLNFAEYTESNLSFDADGFSLSTTGAAAQINSSSNTYIGWQWLAGNSSGSSNTDGSLTSTVTANQTAGFSILTFTGNGGDGGAQTVGHGLGKKPNMIIIKNLSTTDNWVVYHDNVGFNAITLNSTAARITTGASVYWNDTAFTSSVFTVNTHAGVNGDGNTMLCYCFADIPGYSKFGGYSGNDNANGPYIPLNFSPAFVMIKNITAAGGWPMYDNARTLFNPSNKNINADQNAAEYSPDYPIDFLSNGFKIRDAQAYVNDANSYLYMAFAENPFAGPTPATAR